MKTLNPRPVAPARQHPADRRIAPAQVGRRCPCKDERWPDIVDALDQLRAAKRCSVRIIDADCGAGSLLLHAVRYARAIGFTAIEARGIDGVPMLIGRARAAAASASDRAIGVTFETADLMAALAEEQEFPADIVIWHGHAASIDQAMIERAVAAAGRLVITDHARARAAA